MWRGSSVLKVALVCTLLLMVMNASEAQLSSTFYAKTCPSALPTIRKAITTAVSRERRMAASLLRLHFHLLHSEREKNAGPNRGSVRGYDVIENAKAKVEKVSPSVVSCADILAVAARDASFAVGGPSWTVKLGRKDSRTANISAANTELPGFNSDLDRLISMFGAKGLNARDMVALSGAHTLGQAQCFTFRDRIYDNTSAINAGFASTRKRGCPATGGDSKLAALDLVTPNSFDNNYFKNLIQKKGLLHSDQVLFSGGSTDTIVTQYSKVPATFKSDFAAAMIKMSEILGSGGGEVRKICSVIN